MKAFSLFGCAPVQPARPPIAKARRKTTRPQWEGAEEELDCDVTAPTVARVPVLLAGGAR